MDAIEFGCLDDLEGDVCSLLHGPLSEPAHLPGDKFLPGDLAGDFFLRME